MRKSYKKAIMTVGVLSMVLMNIARLQAAPTQDTNTIEVNGSATIKVKPNIAYINTSARTESKEAKKAQEENAKIIEQIRKEVTTKYKLTDEDIRTSSYNVSPSYDYIDGKQIFRAYVVEHQLEIAMKNIDAVGDVVDTLVGSGATSINNIRFDIIDQDATYNLALQKAVRNAKSKSDSIIVALGVKEAKVVSVVEQGGSIGVIERNTSKMYDSAPLMGTATSIMQNEIEVNARVSVIFAY